MDKKAQFLAHKAYLMRRHALTMTTYAGSGHPTSALSAADIVAVLFFGIMRFELSNPENPHNDRFILSKGHACPILYAAYRELGILTDNDLAGYRSFDSALEGHPTPRFKWTEAATGSLGQGLSVGVGMALNAKMEKLEYRTYVLLGDSELAEGSVWEALELGAYNKLNNLIAIVDINRLGQRGETMQGWDLDAYRAKLQAFGWHVLEVNGHDCAALFKTFNEAKNETKKPIAILAKTIKGYGVESVENKNGFHGKVFSSQELPEILKKMAVRFKESAEEPKEIIKRIEPAHNVILKAASFTFEEPKFNVGNSLPTRQAFGQALVQLGKQSKHIVSLDGEVSNSTYAEYFAQTLPERFVEAFIAEQNMIGMAVGFAKLGRIPFCSTFAAFFTRAYDQIRMAAIGRAPLRLVGSHAGVSIGQDGPSQMGLEDISMMRSIPNSIIFYPCDAVSTWKLVGLMAQHNDGISYLRTTRAATAIIYENNVTFSIGGCKVLRESDNDKILIIAAGITLHEALKAYKLLKDEGISAAIIDLYCIKPLDVETLKRVAKKSQGRIITVEDHYSEGGLGEAVVCALKNEEFIFKTLAVTKMPRSGKPEELLVYEEIDAAAIIKAVKDH